MHPYHHPSPSLIERPGTIVPAAATQGARGTAFTGNSLVELLRFRAATQANGCAYTFLGDGETASAGLNYDQLDRRSRAIAALLQARVRPGDRVLLVFPPGLDFVAAFFGCMYAGAVAVPASQPKWGRSQRNLARLTAIAADARPAAVLTTSEIAARLSNAASGTGDPWLTSLQGETGDRTQRVECIVTSSIADDMAEEWRDPCVQRTTLAFLQYTSGSTAAPRGVMISHGNLLHNLAYGFDFAENDATSASVSWLPMTHDMGLIDGVLQPVYSGRPAWLMSPAAFLQRPARWLQAISRYRATRSGAPNFAYDLCVRKVTAEDREELDLSAWRTAYNGAEPVRRETLEAFTAAFAPCGFRPSAFRPCFGLAEATLLVSGSRFRPDAAPRTSPIATPAKRDTDAPHGTDVAQSAVSCGRPAFGVRILVANPNTGHVCRPGETGEIWITGPSIGLGYWNRPEDSARTFQACTDEGEGPFLRTGDLGFLRDGELFVTGRLKDVLIVRGVKHYPHDLEYTAERQHPAIRSGCVAAFAAGADSSGDRIALVAETDPRRFGAPGAAPDVIAGIRCAVAEFHGVQLHAVLLVGPGAVSKTTSGKLQRFACRAAFIAGTFRALAEWRDGVVSAECL